VTDHLDIKDLQKQLRDFAAERDWDKYHNPKNLSMALSVEAGELVEIFQWLTPEESVALAASDSGAKEPAADELADIILYCIRIADKLGINLRQSISHKIAKNRAKYPVDKAKGNAKKYTDL
jgi:NTP pyrophosphatase (non-canonical NTP hydrolase)